MGFGLLFVGYVITFLISLVKFGFVIRLAGYALMAYALIKLREYNKSFDYPMYASFFLILHGIYDFVYQGAGELAITLPSFFGAAAAAVEWIGFIAVTAFNVTLLCAIYSISKSLELPKQKNAALRNIVFISAYFIMNLLGMGPLRNNELYSRYFVFPMLILQLAWIVLNFILIFSCYMYICPEGDEDMKRRKTGITPLDRFLEESDRRLDKAAGETTDYIVKRQKERRERKKNKKNK